MTLKLLLLITDTYYESLKDVRAATVDCLTDYIHSEIPEQERNTFQIIQDRLTYIENEYDKIEKVMRDIAKKVKDAKIISDEIPIENVWYDGIIKNDTGERLNGQGPHFENIPDEINDNIGWNVFERYLGKRMTERTDFNTEFGDLQDTITYRANSLVMSYPIGTDKTFVLIIGLVTKDNYQEYMQRTFNNVNNFKLKMNSQRITKAHDLSQKIIQSDYEFIINKLEEIIKLPSKIRYESFVNLERGFFLASLGVDPLRREQLDEIRYLIIEINNLYRSESKDEQLLNKKMNELKDELHEAIDIRNSYQSLGTTEQQATEEGAVFTENEDGIIELQWKE